MPRRCRGKGSIDGAFEWLRTGFNKSIITGGFSGLFGGNKTETAPFKEEPTRDSLTQPPPGYQTPSPNYAYGTGPKESLNKEYNPAKGKYGE